MVRKTFAIEGDAYIFYNKYARDKRFSVRKQKVKRAKHSGALLLGVSCVPGKASDYSNFSTRSLASIDREP
jgi:hypothetical protein